MIDLGPRGWARFPADARSLAWAGAAHRAATALLDDPAHDGWWRHGRTWFAGVNLLGNSADGSMGDVPLEGPAIDALEWTGGWDAAQVSTVRPDYPGRDPGESEASHRFRKLRDAAHLDGLLPVGPDRRRMVKESHAFILGLPLTEAAPGASPLAVWEGSQDIIRNMLTDAFSGRPVSEWSTVDLTETYQRVRREVFESCPRVTLHANPGEAILVHRLAIHGIAPWELGATAAPEGRIIAYFRPAMPLKTWLSAA